VWLGGTHSTKGGGPQGTAVIRKTRQIGAVVGPPNDGRVKKKGKEMG